MVKLYSVSVTNVVGGVASSCRACALVSRDQQQNQNQERAGVPASSCVPCPAGFYIDQGTNRCRECPPGTHLAGRHTYGQEACLPCGPASHSDKVGGSPRSPHPAHLTLLTSPCSPHPASWRSGGLPLSVYLSLSTSLSVAVFLPLSLSLSLSLFLSVSLCLCLSLSLSAYRSLSVSVSLSISLSLSVFVVMVIIISLHNPVCVCDY